ncbi:MAG: TIGR03943 family protein [Pseudonocardia sp.]|nr:TIGR03943 family protein [Pseudonocardia sp.]
MSRWIAGFLAILTGAVVGKVVLVGAHVAYVRPTMGPYLLAAAVVLILAGAVTVFRAPWPAAIRAGHDHGFSLVSLLVAVPLLLAYAVPHPGLNATTAAADSADDSGVVSASDVPDSSYAPLRVGPDGVATLGLLEVAQRGLSHDGETLRGQRLRIQGFLTPPRGGPGSATISRYVIWCCAADAFLMSVDLTWPTSPPPPPSTGQWYELTARFMKVDDKRVLLTVLPDGVREIPEPADPYEL